MAHPREAQSPHSLPRLKIVLLGPATSIHTQRWALALASRGHGVTLISQHIDSSVGNLEAVQIVPLPFRGQLGYFLNAASLRSWLRRLQPDILNVHYATGYGFTAALVGFEPSLLSVWGSDVFEFPRESSWKARLLRFNLRRVTRLASTSHAMAHHLHALVRELPPAAVTPFGVDCRKFRPEPRRDPETVTIGTVKSLGRLYGTDVLIDAFHLLVYDAELRAQQTAQRLRLLLVGGGAERGDLERQARTLRIESQTQFIGAVPHADVPVWLNRLDIFVAASRHESFGVAAVEAAACGVPTVVTNVGGLPEVVLEGESGLLVPPESPLALAAAIKQLVVNEPLRRRMGSIARQFVVGRYEWTDCVATMEAVYRDVILRYRG